MRGRSATAERMRGLATVVTPDFLALAAAPRAGTNVLFECSSYHPEADGRLVITAATLALGDPGALDEIGAHSIVSWSIADDGTLFELSVHAGDRFRTTLVMTLRASAVSVMRRHYGPERTEQRYT